MTLLFAFTLGLSAFLLFVVELVVGKAVLPALGGVPMVWNTCMVFFQVALLAGYVYAHGTARALTRRWQVLLYVGLLALPLFFLPFPTLVSTAAPSTGSPIWWLILLLVGWIGVPFFVLSTSASVLQHWFAGLDRQRSHDPYMLYAASNLGSIGALIVYPTVIEPHLRLGEQSRWWMVGYSLFVLSASACGALAWRADGRGTSVAAPAPASAEGIPLSRKILWTALAFVPSSLMLAVTSYLSTDIAALPLLWTIPLSLYLLTFVVAFGMRSDRLAALADRAMPLVVLPLAVLLVVPTRTSIAFAVPIHLLVFVVAGLLCHGRLASDRPDAGHLTSFYFWIALGGMLGGLFNTLAAPVLFTGVWEYPLALVLACLLRTGRPDADQPRARMADSLIPLALGALTLGALMTARMVSTDRRLMYLALAVPVFVAFSQSRRHPVRFALCFAAMLIAVPWATNETGRVLRAERTFYGVYRVNLDESAKFHALFNGTTLHGMQALDPAVSGEPLTYYHREGPLGQIVAPLLSSDARVAAVGLGVGSLAGYPREEQHWTFYELDPEVEQLARDDRYFTYLRTCGDRCDVVIGDARISLQRAEGRNYALVVLDAFSSDAIPVHLLTTEALTLYLSRLTEHGVIAVHVSNRHLALSPVMARLAREHGLAALEQLDTVTAVARDKGRISSHWVVLARRESDLGPLAADPRWHRPAVLEGTPLWTDDFSSILRILRFE